MIEVYKTKTKEEGTISFWRNAKIMFFHFTGLANFKQDKNMVSL